MQCEVCGSSKFDANSGFYYCAECGTQNQADQEVEYDTYFGVLDGHLSKTKIKTVSADQNRKKFFFF